MKASIEDSWRAASAENRVRALRESKLIKSICPCCSEETIVFAERANQLKLVVNEWTCSQCGCVVQIGEPTYSHGHVTVVEAPYSADMQAFFLLRELGLVDDDINRNLIILPQYTDYFHVSEVEHQSYITLTKAGEGKLKLLTKERKPFSALRFRSSLSSFNEKKEE